MDMENEKVKRDHAKRRYEKPALVEHGSVRELTRGSGGSITPDIGPIPAHN
jgi:hypothetical protein